MGGDGGVGVQFTMSGATMTNSSLIAGGNGGAPEAKRDQHLAWRHAIAEMLPVMVPLLITDNPPPICARCRRRPAPAVAAVKPMLVDLGRAPIAPGDEAAICHGRTAHGELNAYTAAPTIAAEPPFRLPFRQRRRCRPKWSRARHWCSCRCR